VIAGTTVLANQHPGPEQSALQCNLRSINQKGKLFQISLITTKK